MGHRTLSARHLEMLPRATLAAVPGPTPTAEASRFLEMLPRAIFQLHPSAALLLSNSFNVITNLTLPYFQPILPTSPPSYLIQLFSIHSTLSSSSDVFHRPKATACSAGVGTGKSPTLTFQAFQTTASSGAHFWRPSSLRRKPLPPRKPPTPADRDCACPVPG